MERFDWIEISNDAAPRAHVPKDEPFDAPAYIQRGQRAYRYGAYETALRQFGKALREDASRGEAWLGQVDCLLGLGELEEARTWVNKGLERFPEDAELLATKALALARQGEAPDAMILANRAIAKKDPSGNVWLKRGLVLLALNPKNHSRTCFLKAIEGGDPGGANGLRIGIGYIEAGEPAKAKDYLVEAVEKDNSNPLAWYMLARSCEELYAYGRAVSCYERASSLKPEFDADVVAALERINTRGFFRRIGAFFRGTFAS